MTSALPMIVPQLTHSRRTGKPTGQKPPLQPKEVWAIRVRLQIAGRSRDLALFNLAIDSKLRGCDLVRLKVGDVAQMGQARARAMIIQKKTKTPVRFEITAPTREAVNAWIRQAGQLCAICRHSEFRVRSCGNIGWEQPLTPEG